MTRRTKLKTLTAVSVCAAMTACTQTQMGQGGSLLQGSAGPAGSDGGEEASDGQAKLVTCREPVGTAALVQSDRAGHQQFNLPSPIPTVRLMMQKSGCFRVVERGAASEALQRERKLSEEGELEAGSDMGQGQMEAADFVITPRIIVRDENAGGGAGAAGALLPGMVGAVAGAVTVKEKEAQTMLTVTNVRTSVQEAIAEGSASKTDIGGGGLGFLGTVGGGGGAYESTDIGKIVTAAFMDAHNNLARQLDAKIGEPAGTAGSNWRTTVDLNLRAGPSSEAQVIRTLPVGTAVEPTGRKDGRWWQVDGPEYQGWVARDYIAQRVQG